MKFELYIARRLRLKNYNGSKQNSPSISIAVIGVALAIVIMMIAIVVVLGFKHEIRDKVMGFDAQITISNSDYTEKDKSYITFNDTLKSIINTTIPNGQISLSIKQPGILKTDNDFMGIVFKGMDTNYDWKFISDNLISGSIPNYNDENNQNKIIISKIISSSLKLKIGDKIYAYFFENNKIRTCRFEIAAIYETHFGEYDKLFAFSSLNTLQKLNNIDSITGNSIEIRNLPISEIENSSYNLQDSLIQACYTNKLSSLHRVDTVYNTGALYFNWLDLLDTNVIVILILMSLVSGFTLISSMFIIILERVNMIGIMKSLGATNTQIRRIFIYLTERLVIKGILWGNAIALTIIFLQSKFKLIPLDPEAYYLNYVPTEINWSYILLLNIGVIIISGLILILPSHLISTISPAKTIKFE
jgi:lipoprotein-releasing system permease protein